MTNYVQKRAFILIGASGSGKSTARKEIEAKTGARSFSLDDCRLNFYVDHAPDAVGVNEQEVYKLAFSWCSAYAKEFDAFVAIEWAKTLTENTIIVDNVNSTRKSRAKWVDGLRKQKFHITMVEFQTPLKVILERQLTRGDKQVPAEAVKSQFFRQESAMVGSECDAVISIDGTKPWKYA